MIEDLLVGAIVLAAAGFSAWQLLPAAWWRALRAPARPAATSSAKGPYPACAGCPAGSDCAKRR